MTTALYGLAILIVAAVAHALSSILMVETRPRKSQPIWYGFGCWITALMAVGAIGILAIIAGLAQELAR